MRIKTGFTVFVWSIVVLWAMPALAATYYLSNAAKASDDNDGRSSTTPWKTLQRASQQTYQPGDSLLLLRGGIWQGALILSGSGTAQQPIVLSSYGASASRPLIDGQGKTHAGVLLRNQQHWIIQGLEITNNGQFGSGFPSSGIVVYNSSGSVLRNITIRDNYIHHTRGSLGEYGYTDFHQRGGIIVFGDKSSATNRFEDILIEKNRIDSVSICGILVWDDKGEKQWQNSSQLSHRVTIRENYISTTDFEAILVFGFDTTLIEHNTVYNANVFAFLNWNWSYGVAVFTTRGQNSILQYNEVYNTQYADPRHDDGTGFDIDLKHKNALVQYNYSHDNEGGFLLLMSPNNHDITVRYNISENDNPRNQGHGVINSTLSGSMSNVHIYNNTLYLADTTDTRFLWINSASAAEAWTIENNIFVNRGGGSNAPKNAEHATFSHNVWVGPHAPDDPHLITDDPLFVAENSGGTGLESVDGYKLKAGSTALHSGKKIVQAQHLDYWGNTVEPTTEPHRGAYQGIAVGATGMRPAVSTHAIVKPHTHLLRPVTLLGRTVRQVYGPNQPRRVLPTLLVTPEEGISNPLTKNIAGEQIR